MKPALTLTRALVGGLFVGHGAQKLFGAFGGHGPDATGQFFESVGIRPGKPNAYAAGASEVGGGALLAAGVAVPAAAAALAGVMFTAIWSVHRKNGPWVTDAGWEYNAVLLAAVAAVAEEDRGAGAALASIAAGAAGAAGVITLSGRGQQTGSGPMETATAGA